MVDPRSTDSRPTAGELRAAGVDIARGLAADSSGMLVRFLGLLTMVALTWGGVSAQETDTSSSDSSAQPFPSILKDGTLPFEAELRIPDEDGNLVLIPNMSIEEYLRLTAPGAVGKSYQFESVEVTAIATEDSANVDGKFSVRLAGDSKSAEIPLSFGTCQIGSDPPTVETDATNYQDQFFADANGYRWVIFSESEPEERQLFSIALKGKSRISREGDRKTLRIALPYHNCVVRVRLPADSFGETVRAEDVIESRNLIDDQVELAVRTRGGDFTLSWRAQETLTTASSIESQSVTTFEIGDPKEPWAATTTLSVRWYGNEVADAFTIQLPENARWQSFPEEDFERYTVATTNLGRSSGDDPTDYSSMDSADLEITNLSPSQYRSIELTLEWEWLPQSSSSDSGVMETRVPIPSLLGVDSHSGTIDCICPASYQVVFTEGAGVRLARRNEVASTYANQRFQFRFDGDPFELTLLFRSEQSLAIVRPIYYVQVQSQKLVLTAWLDCSFDANQRPLSLDIDFGEWTPIENSGQVVPDLLIPYDTGGDALQLTTGPNGRTRLSRDDYSQDSTTSYRRSRQIWRVIAELAWDAASSDLSFRIPSIMRGQSENRDRGAGVLLISSEDSVLVQWSESSNGLLRDTLPEKYAALVQGDLDRSPLAFRFQGRPEDSFWTGSVTVLPQLITAREQARIEVIDDVAVISQTFRLNIANTPLTQARFRVPNSLVANNPQFFVNQQLAFGTPDVQQADASSNDMTTFALVGVEPLRRTAELTVQSSLQLDVGESSASDGSRDVTIPIAQLLLPNDGLVERRTIELQSDLDIMLSDSSDGMDRWRGTGEQPVVIPSNAQSVKLRIDSTQPVDANIVTIEKAWLQVAINRAERQDRFLTLFQTDAAAIELRLPESASVRPPARPRIIVDNREIADWSYDQNRDVFRIPLATLTPGNTHKLEILYSVLDNLESWSTLSIANPEITNAHLKGRLFVQIATPKTQHLSWSDSSLVPEWQWVWGGFWWNRQSTFSENNLVQQLQASEARIPSSFNQYLLSSQIPDRTFRVLIVARYLIWFPIGIVAIAIAFIALNYRFARSPIACLAFVFMIGLVAALSPDLSIMLGQASLIALGLVVLVWLTNAAIESRVRRRSVFATRQTADASQPVAKAQSSKITEVRKAESSVIANGGG